MVGERASHGPVARVVESGTVGLLEVYLVFLDQLAIVSRVRVVDKRISVLNLAWRGVAWRGVVWCGAAAIAAAVAVAVWCGVVWCGVVMER